MADDEEEWEYEYDEEDSEVHYITVDFSTHTAPSVPTKKPGTGGGRKSTSHRQAANASNKDVEDVASPSSNDPDTTPKLQILDLATLNPLISYNSHLYTCHWATDIGTTLHFSRPSPTPLRSYADLDLVARTRTRLVAVPARLNPAAGAASPTSTRPPAAAPPLATKGWHLDTREGDRIVYSTDGSMRISVPANASAAKTSQARFLEKWAELKARKGRTDPVPIKSVRNYTLPEGWEEERRVWLRRGREEASVFGGLKPRRRRPPKARAEKAEGRAGKRRKKGEEVVVVEDGEEDEEDEDEEEEEEEEGKGDSDESEESESGDEDDDDEETGEVPGEQMLDLGEQV